MIRDRDRYGVGAVRTVYETHDHLTFRPFRVILGGYYLGIFISFLAGGLAFCIKCYRSHVLEVLMVVAVKIRDRSMMHSSEGVGGVIRPGCGYTLSVS